MAHTHGSHMQTRRTPNGIIVSLLNYDFHVITGLFSEFEPLVTYLRSKSSQM